MIMYDYMKSRIHKWRKRLIFFFWDRLNSFTTIIRRCTHFPTDYLTLLLLFKAEKIPLCIYHIFLKHSSVAKHLVWFCNLAAVNSATVNSNVQVSVMCWLSVFWVNTQKYGMLVYIEDLFLVFEKPPCEFP